MTTRKHEPAKFLQRIKAWPWKLIGCRVGKGVAYVLAALLALYLCGMIYYNGPFQQAGFLNALLALVWLALAISLYQRVQGWKKRSVAVGVAVLIVLLPWGFIQPSNDRDWNPDYAQTGHTEIEGDLVTIHNLRNFDYTMDGVVTERWETRTVHLSNLRGLDLFHDTSSVISWATRSCRLTSARTVTFVSRWKPAARSGRRSPP